MPKQVNGAHRTVKITTTATIRALDAAELVEAGYSFRQALRKAGASYGYTATALRLSPAQRDAVRRGEATLSGFHAEPPISNKVIDRFILKAGFGRVWERLDYLTMPAVVAAE